MNIRQAKPSDAQILADFNIALASESESTHLDPPTVLTGVRAVLADPLKGTYFIAEIDGRPAGCCMITHEWSDWRNGDIWWLQSVYVPPQFRRQGVFRLLYQHVQNAGRAAGAVQIRLYVERANELGKQTYTSLGMSMTHYDIMEQQL